MLETLLLLFLFLLPVGEGQELSASSSIVIFWKYGNCAEVLGLVGQDPQSSDLAIEKFEDVKALDFNN